MCNSDEHQTINSILKLNNYGGTDSHVTGNASTTAADQIHVWVYVPKHPTPPDASHPILQSYIDIIMRGCFNTVGERLARSFISTTSGWTTNANCNQLDHYWVNDRDVPIYKRADRLYSILNAAKIDDVIFVELSAMSPANGAHHVNDSSSTTATITTAYRRTTYDPLLHLEQLTLRLEQDYDSVHPLAFQHWASQMQLDHNTPPAIVG